MILLINTFLTEHLHRFPREGEIINLARIKIVVIEMKKNVIEKVKITKKSIRKRSN